MEPMPLITRADAPDAQPPTARFGELLRSVVPLSNQQVEEILSEQTTSGLRFGEAALSLGYCAPDHVRQVHRAKT